eukprot:2414874-Amphidinium_carterae.1
MQVAGGQWARLPPGSQEQHTQRIRAKIQGRLNIQNLFHGRSSFCAAVPRVAFLSPWVGVQDDSNGCSIIVVARFVTVLNLSPTSIYLVTHIFIQGCKRE